MKLSKKMQYVIYFGAICTVVLLLIVIILNGVQLDKNIKGIALLQTEKEQYINEINTLKVEKEQLNKNNEISDENIRKIQDDLLLAQKRIDELEKQNYDNPVFDFYNVNANYSKIVVKDDKTSIDITDPQIIEAISSLFFIQCELTNIYDMAETMDRPWEYDLYSESGEKTIVYLEYDPIVTFEKLPQRHFLSSFDINQPGRAFLNPPSGRPEETTLNKMADSGMMLIENQGNPLIMLNSYFIKKYTYNLNASITQTGEVELPPNAIETWTYYYFGEKIKVFLYNGFIRIVDTEVENFYKINDVQKLINYRSYI